MRLKIPKEAIKLLKNNEVGVIHTDTIYGLTAGSFSKKAVEKIYKLKERDKGKPFVIVISTIGSLKLFGININKEEKKILSKYWPGKVSIILPITDKAAIKKFKYLHRGTNTLAFRLPKEKWLINFIKKTGPLSTSSANPQGEKFAATIEEAEQYFGKKASFYLDKGRLKGSPSKLIKIEKGKVMVLRK